MKNTLENIKSYAGGITSVLLSIIGLLVVDTLGYEEHSLNDSLTQASQVFATAKVLNAIISVAQGTEIGPPGVTIAIGEILDPVNDLVEQFAWIMLLALSSLGIQKIVFVLLSVKWILWVLIGAIVILNIMIIKQYGQPSVRIYWSKIVLILLFARFSVVLFVMIGELMSGYLATTLPSYNITQAQSELFALKNEAKSLQIQTTQSTQEGFMAKAKAYILDSKSKINQTINKYQEISVEMSEKIIDLITIFIFNTVLLPLLYLYLMLKGVRAIWISEIIEI